MNISNSQDYTITPIIFSKSGYLNDIEYRSITERSNLKVNIIGGIVDTFKEQDEEVISGFLTFDSKMKITGELKLYFRIPVKIVF